MNDSNVIVDFKNFCDRFVRNYWDEIAQGTPDLPGSEPCEKSLKELLSEIEYDTSFEHIADRERLGMYTLRMTNTTGDVWRFTFLRKDGRWTSHSASSGTRYNVARVNWLDEVYSQWFVPFLNRLISKSLLTPPT